VVIVVTTYSGNLVAFLTFPRVEPSIVGLQRLLGLGRDGQVTWSIPQGSYIEEYLKISNEERFKEFMEKAELLARPLSNESLLQSIINDDHTHIDWGSKLDLMMKKQHQKTGECDFALAKHPIFTDRTALAFQKGFPWIPKFNHVIRQLDESRLMIHWRNLYWPSDNNCDRIKVTKGVSSKVTILDMSGSFFILGLGCAVALLIFSTEIFTKSQKEENDNIVKPFVS